MIKKLRLCICFAAALLPGAQALLAQTSPTAEVTHWRFGTDVDDFFDVNYWSGVEFSNWFSYLKVANDHADPLSTTTGFLSEDDGWEAGAALKIKDVYLGLFYTGSHNNGETKLGSYGPEGGPLWDSSSPGDVDLDGSGSGGATALSGLGQITRDNFFGVLIGAKDSGWKVTVEEEIAYAYLPYVRDSDGNEGYAQYRDGTITPALAWGAAKDLSLGKFSLRPSAGVSLAVHYDTDGFIKIGGEDVYRDSYAGNSITPTVTLNTGNITVKSGDWGALKLGADETFVIPIRGDGSGSNAVDWENSIAPYAVFSFDATDYFKIGAKLRIPVSFGYDTAGTDTGFIGVGKYKAPDPHSPATPSTYPGLLQEGVISTLGVGIQFIFTSDGPLGGLTDKIGISDKLTLNGGAQVILPSYMYTLTGSGDTKAHQHGWSNKPTGNSDLLQVLSLGASFAITPKVLLDASYDIGNKVTGWNNLFADRLVSVTLSAKY